MTKKLRSFLLLSSGIVIIGLTACGGGTKGKMDSSDTSASAVVDKALMRAANQTTAQGMNAEGLRILETIYKRNPKDPEAAMKFARGLREMNELTKAAIILEPFVNDPDSPSALKLEYAATQLEAGRYERAEEVARAAVKQNPLSGFGYHILGTALDAQGLHEQSEKAFREALKNWVGDPVPVMNNLALSLTAQEKLDEAHEILLQAKAADPSRIEIERNLRIINALRETSISTPNPAGRTQAPMPLDIHSN